MAKPDGGGRKSDGSKVALHLIPPELVVEIGKVLTFGAAKYAPRNWERGMEWHRAYGALLRHMLAWWNGEELDPETGLSHLAHAGCCLAFLITYAHRPEYRRFDDRPHTPAAAPAGSSESPRNSCSL